LLIHPVIGDSILWPSCEEKKHFQLPEMEKRMFSVYIKCQMCLENFEIERYYIDILKSKKFKDTKRVIRNCQSKKIRLYNGEKKKEDRTSNELQNNTQKTKD
jgi:hypothetical protein